MVSLVARLAALAALVLMTAGCAPDCRNACRHLLQDCGIERTDWGIDDCSSSCNDYLTHYEDDWQKEESRRGVRCVANASCEDLRSGTPCYDEAIYIW